MIEIIEENATATMLLLLLALVVMVGWNTQHIQKCAHSFHVSFTKIKKEHTIPSENYTVFSE